MKATSGEYSVSMGVAQSFMLAGNIEFGKRKVLAASGPAIVLAERLENCNAAHRTQLMVDPYVAEAVSTAIIASFDFTVRPVALLRVKDDSDEFLTGFAVYNFRMRQERLKAWNVLFNKLPEKIAKGAAAEALLEVEDYKLKHVPQEVRGKKGAAVDRTVESWRRNLTAMVKLKEMSLGNRNATEFGV
jgi:hypothetical protein